MKRSASPETLFVQLYETDKRLKPTMVPKTYDGTEVADRKPGRPYKYEVHEAVPDLPIFHESFKEIEKHLAIAVNLLWERLDRGRKEDRDDQLECLGEQLCAARTIDYGAKLLIALEGDTASGKSLLLNNLLGLHKLAESGDVGQSCTQLITEYTFKEHGAAKYEAHILWQELNVVASTIREHLDNYLAYHHARARTGTGQDDELSPDELFSCKATAVELFQTTFCDQPQFRTEASMETYLLYEAEKDKAVLVKKLVKNVEDVIHACEDNHTHQTVRTANTLPELQGLIAAFVESTNTASHEPRYWPFVRKVRIYLKSSFLGQDVEIADYPGGTDTNTMRTNASSQYLTNECSAVLITSTIARAGTAPSLMRSLHRAVASKGPHNVLLALTHCDTCDSDFKNLNSEAKGFFALLKKDVELAEGAVARAADEDDDEAVSEARNMLKLAEHRQTKERTLIRNRKLVPEVQDKYQTVTAPHLLRTVPVANKDYERHMRYTGQDSVLDPCETGVPELRSCIYHMVSRQKMTKVMQHYGLVKQFSTRLLLWSERERNDRKEDVNKLVETPLSACGNLLDPLTYDAGQLFRLTFVDPFRAKHQRNWNVAIKGQIASWGATIHATSFKAFLSRQGVHQPRNQARLSMPEELMNLVETDIWAFYQELAIALKNTMVWVDGQFEGVFTKLRKSLEDSDDLVGFDMPLFFNAFDLEKAAAAAHLKEDTDALIVALHTIVSNAVTHTQTTIAVSPWLRRIRAIFDECKGLPGGLGVHRKRISTLSKLICDIGSEGPFPVMLKEIAGKLEAKVLNWIRNLTKRIHDGLKAILGLIDLRFSGKEMSDHARNKLQEELKAIKPQFDRIMEVDIPRLIGECEGSA